MDRKQRVWYWKVAVLVELVGFVLVGEVWASFDEGWQAYTHGDYVTALQAWQPLAEQGHASAQYNLGVMYDAGQGVPQDYPQAVAWYRKAAAQGHTSAQTNLGGMYVTGQGVPQDYPQAIGWYQKAAAQGDASAQTNLGGMYAHGRGVKPLRVVAYALYTLSAAQEASTKHQALHNRATLMETMSPKEIEAGQKLTRELAQPGNFLRALEGYVQQPTVKEPAASPPGRTR